ncbi:MAG: DNA gyrase/topoisomerase IV subunit A [Bacteroidales bacterium]|nr:DNA gyrase/topoisomerase IV subunit A [Bacteroidales bacterium]
MKEEDLDNLNEEEQQPVDSEVEQSSDLHNIVYVQSMFKNWFLDYASYVILDRALPDVYDGLKPVQRRILHSMNELEDGRFNKVANIVGNTMKYHPHGDSSIAGALVQIGQKQLVVDTQGNWGNILTGDPAAAPRYIEARLTPFAKEVVFNAKTTEWQRSYDGRNKEPIALPIKFPLLLAQGVEGIAVGLATSILPHNFNELLDASVAILENRDFEIYPDFPTGGSLEVTKYNDGLRGGKLRCRAKITIKDNRTLVITEIPFGTTTTDLINNSITPAIEKGKLKIKKVDDNTAKTAEILLHLMPNVSPDQTIDALYAFTDCEKTYSPNSCVIYNGHPAFLSVKEILKINTENTVKLLQRELQIQLQELEDQWHWISLEKLFFEKEIYKELENKNYDLWEDQVTGIERRFDPYRKLLKREITREDVLKLCEKPVRKISKFDIKKAEDQIAAIELDIDEVKNHLEHLIDYSINYFKQIKKKYGKGRERKTEIKTFDNIVATTVAVANLKLYVNRKEGFVGTNLKRDEMVEYVGDCSDIDDIIVFGENGKFVVKKVCDKVFIGKDIIHVEVFKRNNDRVVFNMVYSDGKNGSAMVKRFSIGGVTRDKEYDLTAGKPDSKVLYLTSNPNGEAEKIKVYLKPKPKMKKTQFDFDFSTLAIKSRGSKGNILSRNPVRKIEMSEKGVSTLSAINVYYDATVMKLNNDERGELLGAFKEDDRIIAVYKSGYYRITGYDLSTHFDDDLLIIRKFHPNRIITAVYYNKKDKQYIIKRFQPELTEKKIDFIPVDKDIRLEFVSIDYLPQIEVKYHLKDPKGILTEVVNVAEFVDVMKVRAKGKVLRFGTVTGVKLLEPLPDPEEMLAAEAEVEEPIEEQDDDADGVIENIDDAVAKERFDMDEDILPVSKDDNDDTDGEGEQLSLF